MSAVDPESGYNAQESSCNLIFECLQKSPALARLTSSIRPAQFRRYLVVAVWNRVFGYSSFVIVTAALTPYLPHAYILTRRGLKCAEHHSWLPQP